MGSTLAQLGLVDLLAADPRPAFVVDLALDPPSVAYTSPACFRNDALYRLLTSPRDEDAELWLWVSRVARHPHGHATLFFAGILWTKAIVHQTWLVISANEQTSSGKRADGDDPREVRTHKPKDTSTPPWPPAEADVRLEAGERSNGHNSPLSPASKRPSIQASQLQLPPFPGLERRALSTSAETPTNGAVAVGTMSAQISMPRPVRRSNTDPGFIVPDILAEQQPFLDVFNSVDWGVTPLGPMDKWKPRLEQTVNQILADSRPMALYWGEECTAVYNEAFSKLCGSRHPFLLGRPVDETWPESSTDLKEAMRMSAESRRTSDEHEWRHFVERGSISSPDQGCWLEEVYLKWSVIPIFENDECLGYMHPVLETTSMRLWERRMRMLIELGDMLVTSRSVKSYWAKLLEQMEMMEPRYDIPLVILYSVENDTEAHTRQDRKYNSTKICRLEGSLGVPEGHPIMPQTLPLWKSDEALSSMFRKALRLANPLMVQTADGTLPPSLIQGLQWRGFGDPCRAAVICPIRPTKEEDVMGFVFLGLNPRRPYDNDYRQCISLLSQKMTTSLASTVLLEEEARRGRNMAEQAAYDQAMLKAKLDIQTKEATESIQKFEAVAEFIPVGMCFGDIQGNINFANDAWCRITGISRENLSPAQGYLPCVVEEDRSIVADAYEQLQSRQSVTFEFRVRAHDAGEFVAGPAQESPSFERAGLDLVSIDSQADRHVLASAKAERAPDGSIVRVLTCLTDVTLHKQTAEEAVRRAQQAENLKRMAEFATVGMCDMDLQGRLLGANNVFFEMCGIEKVDPESKIIKPWKDCVTEEDYPVLLPKMEAMVAEGKVQTVEVRFKNPWMAEDGTGNTIRAARWVHVTLMPVKDSEGIIKSFTVCLSDVSLQKWQLEKEKERKEQALESKRQQENFIDMTSHEMRNPLSAIIHCADAVTATLTQVKELIGIPVPAATTAFDSSAVMNGQAETRVGHNEDGSHHGQERALLDDCIENTEIIVTCAQHQKRIVDDILTMSKLDSQLLAVTPITVNTIEVVQEALRMFEVEARRVDIDLSMTVDRSYHELGLTYLEFDPSRLKQVLINLLTNALKFTKTGATRSVTLSVSASRTRPTYAHSSVQFIPRSNETYDEENLPKKRRDPGEPPIFLMFEVKDTGQGLTPEEMKSLFQRFVQGSSRTHVKYGGSGLGLFISRRLTELQNGEIGVASLPGVGSTFAFYIEAHVPSEDSVREAQAAAAVANHHLPAVPNPKPKLKEVGPVSSPNEIPPTTPTQRLPLLGSQVPNPASTSTYAGNIPLHSAIEGVLVVEDNLINQRITRRWLDKYYRTDVANHGIEALEKVCQSDRYIPETISTEHVKPSLVPSSAHGSSTPRPFPLSLILMDIEMPVQDGLTCTRRIRDMEKRGRIAGGRIPIIACSANARAEQVQEAKEAGCDEVMVKPYRMHELIAKMETVFRNVAERPLPDGTRASDPQASVAKEDGDVD